MTFNRDTYTSDLLRVFGGENVFGGRERAYPLEADLGLVEREEPGDRDVRYPRVTAKEIIEAGPEVILLPNEPFQFNKSHKNMILEKFFETPAVKSERVFFVDGTLLMWHGTRIGKALQVLPGFFI
jgi:ABC-type Fe3+-hydroxamate transport system substrate-binding protein